MKDFLWIKNTKFNPLLLSECEVSKKYLKTKWVSLNDLVNPIEISEEERSDMVKLVINYLSKEYPKLKKLNNRDNKNSVLQLFEKTAISGVLPSLSNSINETVNYMILTILKETILNRKKWIESLYQVIMSFKDCQQVQYRTITEMYKKIKNMGSLEMRIASIVDTWKYNWFRKMLETNISFIEPHIESFYISKFGEELGFLETDAANADKLAKGESLTIDKMRNQLWQNIINVQDIFDDVYNLFRGIGITEDEGILASVELKNYLSNNNLYSTEFYDIDSGHVTYDTTVKVLLLLGVFEYNKEIETKNYDYVYSHSNEKYVDQSEGSYKYEDEGDYKYDEDEYEEGEYNDQDDEDYEYDDTIYNTPKVEELIIPPKVFYYKIDINEVPQYLLDTIGKYDPDESLGLEIKCKDGIVECEVKCSSSKRYKYLKDYFNMSIESQKLSVKKCDVLEDEGYLKDFCKKIVENVYKYINYCPICGKKHNTTPKNIISCTNSMCLEKFILKKMGTSTESQIIKNPEYVDVIISITYFALKESNRNDLRDLNFTPFPEKLINKGKRSYELVKRDLDDLPSVDILSSMIETQDFKSYFEECAESAEILYVLEWILLSNRTSLKYINKKGDLTEFEKTLYKRQIKLFSVLNPPEVENDFEKTKIKSKCLKTEMVYHGSPKSAWHGILRNGLQIMSNTKYQTNGSAYGSGIYFGADFDTSYSYSNKLDKFDTDWPQSQNKINYCMMIGEFIDHNNTDSLGTKYPTPPPNFRITREKKYFIPRYLMIG